MQVIQPIIMRGSHPIDEAVQPQVNRFLICEVRFGRVKTDELSNLTGKNFSRCAIKTRRLIERGGDPTLGEDSRER